MQKGGVAFFDSGIGGLSVMAECAKYCAGETFYYFGDNENAPYGNLPREKIEELVFCAFMRLSAFNPKAAVVGCNTATAVCVEKLRKEFSFPIVGAEPAVFSAAKQGGKILVLATCATCASPRFHSLCRRAGERYPQAEILPVPCERLAGEIERNVLNAAFDCTRYLPSLHADAVVLGCTHYTFQKKQIADFYQCPVFDGNLGIAKRLRSFLEQPPTCDHLSSAQNPSKIVFLGSAKHLNQFIFEQTFGREGF